MENCWSPHSWNKIFFVVGQTESDTTCSAQDNKKRKKFIGIGRHSSIASTGSQTQNSHKTQVKRWQGTVTPSDTGHVTVQAKHALTGRDFLLLDKIIALIQTERETIRSGSLQPEEVTERIDANWTGTQSMCATTADQCTAGLQISVIWHAPQRSLIGNEVIQWSEIPHIFSATPDTANRLYTHK